MTTSRLQIIVDGQTAYEGDVDPIILPSRPAMFPDAIRATSEQPTPLAKLMMLTALIELVRRALESPMLQPAEVDIQTHGMGRVTIAIELDLPTTPA